jgi:hypothetical protein
MPQIHWWAWPLLVVVVGPWLVLRSRPALWRKFAFIRLGRIGPILRAERTGEETRAADYRAPLSERPTLPVLEVGRAIERDIAVIRAVGPSIALAKAREAKRRFGGGEILGILTIELVEGDGDSAYAEVRFAPPPGSTITALLVTLFVIRDFGHIYPLIYALPVIGAFQLARGFERHRALLPLVEKTVTKLLATTKTDGGAFIWSGGGPTSEAPRPAERGKPRRKRRADNVEQAP